jgi:hypothetical protein
MSDRYDDEAGYDVTDPWRADQDNFGLYGSVLQPDCAEAGMWCGQSTGAHCYGCGACPGSTHPRTCPEKGSDQVGDIADEDESNYGIHEWAAEDNMADAFRWGRPLARLTSETLPDQLVREATPDGRYLSRKIAWHRAHGWDRAKLERVFGLTARRIRRKVIGMENEGGTDRVSDLIRRHFPKHVQLLTQTLLAEDHSEKRFPSEPPEHAVLLWEQTYPNSEHTYHYVAIRAGDQWWMTGRPDRNPSPIGWPELEKKVGNQPCRIATQWAEFPVIEQRPVMNPAEWFEKVIKNRHAVDADSDNGGEGS